MIEYSKEGRQIGTTPWPGSLEVTIKVARLGCNRLGADFVQIVDVGGGNNGGLVGKVRRLTLRDARTKALHVAPQQSSYQKTTDAARKFIPHFLLGGSLLPSMR